MLEYCVFENSVSQRRNLQCTSQYERTTSRRVKQLTAHDYPKYNANDKVPDRHADHNTCNGDILPPIHSVSRIPQRLLDKIDPKDEN